MPIDIDNLSEVELVDLNNRIVARLKLVSRVRNSQTKAFDAGEDRRRI